jgi:hypothetical protein
MSAKTIRRTRARIFHSDPITGFAAWMNRIRQATFRDLPESRRVALSMPATMQRPIPCEQRSVDLALMQL